LNLKQYWISYRKRTLKNKIL